MPQNICLTLEYDGTGFAGWQKQRACASIQETVERAIVTLTGVSQEAVSLSAAGRTDAGVHALGQVANFHTPDMREARRFAPALNHFLPPTVRVHRAERVADNFDSRHHALGKHYRYTLCEGSHASALYLRRAWHVRRPLQLAVMSDAAQLLEGRHDFESFRSAHCDAPHAVRHLESVKVVVREEMAQGRLIEINLHGRAFCRHMCRILCGTLVEVGLGLREPEHITTILAARDRQAAGMTAPPWGLTLVRVVYPAA